MRKSGRRFFPTLPLICTFKNGTPSITIENYTFWLCQIISKFDTHLIKGAFVAPQKR